MAAERGLALVRISETDNNATDFDVGDATPKNNNGDVGLIDGIPGDADGSGFVDDQHVSGEVEALFARGKRCDFEVDARGADANVDTRVNAADVVATIRILANGLG